MIEKCIADVRSWFIENRLMINDAKTDSLIIGTRQQLVKTSIESVIIGDTVIRPLESVRNRRVLVRCSYANECSHGQDLQQGFSRTIQHKTDQEIPYRAIHKFKDIDPCL